MNIRKLDCWFVIVGILTIAMASSVFAQTTPAPADPLEPFLQAFRGKPVASVPEVSYAPLTTATAAAQQSRVEIPPTSGIRPGDSQQPGTCPPGVDRLGCPRPSAPVSAGRNTSAACPPGFTRDPTGCVVPAMPLHAHRINSDGMWSCEAGYLRSNDDCVVGSMPENAHAASNQAGFACNYGYNYVGTRCALIFVPANAHLSADGSRFECNSGYRDIGMSCTQ